MRIDSEISTPSTVDLHDFPSRLVNKLLKKLRIFKIQFYPVSTDRCRRRRLRRAAARVVLGAHWLAMAGALDYVAN